MSQSSHERIGRALELLNKARERQPERAIRLYISDQNQRWLNICNPWERR